MAARRSGKKENDVTAPKKEPDEAKFDFERAVGPDPRDPRTTGPPCNGKHVPAPMHRGSQSGKNQSAMWTACSVCGLRLRYVPAYGAHGIHRKAGPLPSDVKLVTERLEKEGALDEQEVTRRDLRDQAVSLEGAEASLTRKLEEIRSKRDKLKQGSRRPHTDGDASDRTSTSSAAAAAAAADVKGPDTQPARGSGSSRSTKK